jgi:hypothetical protein
VLPFTRSQFFEVFAAYNEDVWPAQWVLLALAAAATALAARGGPRASRGVPAVLALLWAWMAAAYHATHFSAINPAAWLFAALFAAAAVAFAMAALAGRLRFEGAGAHRTAGWLWIAVALVAYPLAGYAAGHRYPAFPTFGLPCPTTIFTLGLLHLAARPVPRAVLLVPLLWSVLGAYAAFRLGVPQDLALLAAGLASAPLVALPARRTATAK